MWALGSGRERERKWDGAGRGEVRRGSVEGKWKGEGRGKKGRGGCEIGGCGEGEGVEKGG